MTTPPTNERWFRAGIQVWTVIGVLILLAVAGWALSQVSVALVPFMTAVLIVVALRPPVQWLADRGWPRAAAVALCYVIALVVLTVAALYVLPPFIAQAQEFVMKLPERTDALTRNLNAAVTGLANVPESVRTWIAAVPSQVAGWLSASGEAILSWLLGSIGQVAGGVISAVLALIVAFYTLMDLPKMGDELLGLVPERFQGEASIVASTVSRVLGGWLKGAVTDSAVIAVLMSIGLSIAGVPYAIVIGVLGGMLNVVPYVGPAITATLAGLSGVFVSPLTAVWAIAVVFAVQQFDSLWLNPRIMAEHVDLHPVLVVLSILVGAQLFGVPGILLAVPVAAILKGLFVYFYERRTRTTLATEDGVLFRMRSDGDEDAPARRDDEEERRET